MTVWSFFKKYLGWRNWSVFYYNSIFENLFLVFYLALELNDFSNLFLLKILCFLLFSILSTSFGYLINDYADIELDQLHNKPNTFAQDSKWQATLILLLILLGDMISAIPFISAPGFIPLYILWLFLAGFYSLRPLRFKERGLSGLFVAIFAQKVVPVILLFVAFDFLYHIEIILLIIYILLRGAASDINHQLEDFKNDQSTDTKTFAVKFGWARLQRLFQFVLLLERYFFVIILASFLYRFFDYQLFGFPYFASPLLVYLVLLVIGFSKSIRQKNLDTNPFAEEKNIYQLIHLVFPNIFLPVYFILVLTMINPLFSIFLVLYIFLFRLFDPVVLKASIIGRFFFK